MNKSWDTLKLDAERLKSVRIEHLFEQNSRRFEQFSLQVENLFLDYSKNLIDGQVMTDLIALLKDSQFENWRDRFFIGEHINHTEDRAVLHTALRQTEPHPIFSNGENILPQIENVKSRMRQCAQDVRDKTWRGFSGKAIEHIVHIGIGGSSLGPAMAINALKAYHDPDLTCDFVSNVDGHDIQRITDHYNPETTLFLIASKSFTTQETMLNAHTARDWILQHFNHDPDAIKQHFIALSSNAEAVDAFGINKNHMFEFWDWVGGRYSLWSSIGLVIAIMIGMDRFEDLLEGANVIDRHFQTAPPQENLPVILALIGIWNRNFLNHPYYSVIPYDERLKTLPYWLQQLDMESNGKSVDKNGDRLQIKTGPIIMGGAGTDVQHSFFQWMHQGTDICPLDFIICARPDHPYAEQHQTLVSHFLAQQQALLHGYDDQNAPHKHFDGNRPSNALVLDCLTPYTLGQLLAVYEHKIFVQGVIWNINSFDQFGVELGKKLAKDIEKNWEKPNENNDSSTLGLLNHIKNYLGA